MELIMDSFYSHQDLVYLLTFATFLGLEVIAKVPTVLHTPLMSGSNAISGVVVIGSIILLRQTETDDVFGIIIGMIGVISGMVNLAGGFAVTHRMLEMFSKKRK